MGVASPIYDKIYAYKKFYVKVLETNHAGKYNDVHVQVEPSGQKTYVLCSQISEVCMWHEDN